MFTLLVESELISIKFNSCLGYFWNYLHENYLSGPNRLFFAYVYLHLTKMWFLIRTLIDGTFGYIRIALSIELFVSHKFHLIRQNIRGITQSCFCFLALFISIQINPEKCGTWPCILYLFSIMLYSNSLFFSVIAKSCKNDRPKEFAHPLLWG